jgi:hypothetical protein
MRNIGGHLWLGCLKTYRQLLLLTAFQLLLEQILGIFPPPGQPAVLRSEILQGMDPERAAQLVHELPPRPLRMNYPPMGGPGGMGGPFGNMGFGGFRNNHHHHINNNGGPTGANGVDHTVARQQRRLYCGNLPLGINEVTNFCRILVQELTTLCTLSQMLGIITDR